jgi:basic amino acid/polyamine antiporter, APA family
MAELKRVFTARDIAILTVGSVIGSGIFLVPTSVLRDSGGSVGLAMAVWVVGGLLSFLGALTYAELGAMNPGAGGLYLYLRDAFGRPAAFVYGWTLFVVIGSGTVATLAVAASGYLAELVPIAPLTQKIIAVSLALGLCLGNVPSTERSAGFIKFATWLKVGAIALLVIVLPVKGDGIARIDHWLPTTFSGGLISSAGLALVSVLWAYEGWQYLTFLAGETIEPQRNFPRGLAIGTFALIVIYVAAAIAYVAGLGPDGVLGAKRVAADAAGTVIGPVWSKLISIPIIVSMISAAQSNSLASARVYYAMAKDGVFFTPMGRIHPKFGTPAFALVAAGIWSAILAASGTFETLLSYVIFVGWIFYSMGALAVIVMRRKAPNAPRPYRVPGYPFTPILFVLSGLAIVVNTLVQDPRKGVIGLGGTLLALPVFYVWQRLRGARGAEPAR